ncbi:DUF3152 domain-containing protein [Spirillospora albida]|uniref:DUF3152 domain-containing protein n=1 Tax=Spirillospora albida TaxID=58123 RepID=UPI000A3E2B6F|nr:DUF3152 domain-containing protein [Spirillospora albida]
MHPPHQPPAPAAPGPRPPGRRGRGRRAAWIAAGAAAALTAATAAALTLRGGDPASSPGASPPRAGAPASAPRRPAAAPRRPVAGVLVNGRRQPPRIRSPRAAAGRYTVVRTTAAAPPGTRGAIVRYMVEVERGLPMTGAEFAAQVHRVLNDPRGWGHGGRMRFVRVSRGPVRFRVALSSPALTDRMCAPLITGGQLSCRAGSRSVINARRYLQGAATYGRDLASYREYLINHEVGHALGHGHRTCPGPGRVAPVMVQQTKSLYGCRPGPWPHPKG